jgi:RimJ/RimL family protein N-acetyltransferase
VGEKLSRLTIDWFREQKVHSVEVEMLRENDAIWRLYDRMGFKIEYRVARLMWEEYVDEKTG